MNETVAVRVPASSANLGAGFDVLALALSVAVDAVRNGGDSGAELDARRNEVLDVAAALEGHGDNAAASTFGGVVAWVAGRALPLRLGPQLRAATVVAWVPDTATSTDRSRSRLAPQLERGDVVHILGRVAQFVLAVEHDDAALLVGATDDCIHQAERLQAVPGAAEALDVGVRSGAWCGWLSGSGSAVALLCEAAAAATVAASLPETGHTKTLRIDGGGVQLV